MIQVAALKRGMLTLEQGAVIEREMREVLGFDQEAPTRFAIARFATEQVASAEDAISTLAPLLRRNLTASERKDLSAMLRRVAEVHGGPTDLQTRAIRSTQQRLSEAG
jgi:hypothetical protein